MAKTPKVITKAYLDRYNSRIKPHLEEIRRMRLAGYSKEAIATNLAMTINQFDRYLKLFPDLQQAMSTSTEQAVVNVTNALYKSCFPQVKVLRTITYDAKGRVQQTIEKETYIPASTKAQEFFLRSKAPQEWSGDVQDTSQLDALSQICDALRTNLKDGE